MNTASLDGKDVLAGAEEDRDPAECLRPGSTPDPIASLCRLVSECAKDMLTKSLNWAAGEMNAVPTPLLLPHQGGFANIEAARWAGPTSIHA